MPSSIRIVSARIARGAGRAAGPARLTWAAASAAGPTGAKAGSSEKRHMRLLATPGARSASSSSRRWGSRRCPEQKAARSRADKEAAKSARCLAMLASQGAHSALEAKFGSHTTGRLCGLLAHKAARHEQVTAARGNDQGGAAAKELTGRHGPRLPGRHRPRGEQGGVGGGWAVEHGRSEGEGPSPPCPPNLSPSSGPPCRAWILPCARGQACAAGTSRCRGPRRHRKRSGARGRRGHHSDRTYQSGTSSSGSSRSTCFSPPCTRQP